MATFEERPTWIAESNRLYRPFARKFPKQWTVWKTILPSPIETESFWPWPTFWAVSNQIVKVSIGNFNTFDFSVVFGVLKATSGSTDWDNVSTGNKIQVFAQILYGYGYWGPFALEYEASKVDCGLSDLERTLYEYGYVTDYDRAALDPKIGGYFTSELNSAIKENLYCLVIKKLH